jgi:hypothetical protein
LVASPITAFKKPNSLLDSTSFAIYGEAITMIIKDTVDKIAEPCCKTISAYPLPAAVNVCAVNYISIIAGS